MLKTPWNNLVWSEKMLIIGQILAVTGLSMMSIDIYLARRISYEYRSTILDTVDYILGKNVFHRKESLQ